MNSSSNFVALNRIHELHPHLQGARLRFDDKLRTVSEYLMFRDVDANLKRRILAHFGRLLHVYMI